MKKKLFIIFALFILGIGMLSIPGKANSNFEFYDFEGETVTFYGVAEYPEEPWKIDLVEEAEEKFNVNIEIKRVPSNERAEFALTRVMAGDSNYDYYQFSDRVYYQLVSQGALYPLTELLTEKYLEKLTEVEKQTLNEFKYDGKYYMFNPQIEASLAGIVVTHYNRDMIAREGLPDPYELWKEGKWTWETLDNIVHEITSDTNGDGEIDRFGLWAKRWQVYRLMLSNGADTFKMKDGKWTFTADEPQAIEALEQFFKWNEDGVITAEGLHRASLRDGKIAMYFDALNQIARPAFQEMEDNYSIVPLPKGPSVDEHAIYTGSIGNTVLPINAEKPEAMIALDNFLQLKFDKDNYDQEYHKEKENAVEQYSQYLRDKGSLEVWENLIEKYTGQTLWKDFTFPGISYQIWSNIFNKGQSPRAAVEAIKEEWQHEIDEVLN